MKLSKLEEKDEEIARALEDKQVRWTTYIGHPANAAFLGYLGVLDVCYCLPCDHRSKWK